MFYLIGIGLDGWKGISVNGLELAKSADFVYIENFTNVIDESEIKALQKEINKEVVILSREDIEVRAEEKIISKAKNSSVCLIIGGDPLTATTHIELVRLCKEKKLDYKVIHAASIYNSVCETGLHAYRFGKSTSIPYPEHNYKPTSFFDIIENNYKNDAHTLVFLDIKKEKNKFMTIREGLMILLEISKERKSFFDELTPVIGVARLGYNNQKIRYGSVKTILNYDFGPNPHVLIIPKMTKIEEEYVKELYGL